LPFAGGKSEAFVVTTIRSPVCNQMASSARLHELRPPLRAYRDGKTVELRSAEKPTLIIIPASKVPARRLNELLGGGSVYSIG